MTEIERLAQVAHDAACVEVSSSDFFLSDDGAANIVRAILTALREPSEGMLQAGEEEAETVLWQAMIDHILGEARGPEA